MFCRVDINHWQKLNKILQLYERASRQKLNANKTVIFFSRNTGDGVKNAILWLTAILETQRYDSYLGLLTLVGKSRTKEFQAIVDRVEKRLKD